MPTEPQKATGESKGAPRIETKEVFEVEGMPPRAQRTTAERSRTAGSGQKKMVEERITTQRPNNSMDMLNPAKLLGPLRQNGSWWSNIAFFGGVGILTMVEMMEWPAALLVAAGYAVLKGDGGDNNTTMIFQREMIEEEENSSRI